MHPTYLPLSKLLKQLEDIGPIIEFHSLEELGQGKRKVALCRFQHVRHAEDATTCTKWIIKTEQQHASYSAKISYRVFTNSHHHSASINKHKLFCRLPYKIPLKRRELSFFEHFPQFGHSVYHKVLYENDKQMSFGYVEFANDADTITALRQSDPIYGARYADGRERKWDQDQQNQSIKLQKYYICDHEIRSTIFEDHQKTCLWQLQRRNRLKKENKSKSAAHKHSQQTLECNNITVTIINDLAVSTSVLKDNSDTGHTTSKKSNESANGFGKTLEEDEEITADINPENKEYLEINS